jgi:hypothetical protein
MTRPRAIAVICLVAALGCWAGIRPGQAQEADQGEFQFGELIDCGGAITKYFDEVAAAGEQPTYWGLEQALRDKYQEIITRLHAFEDRSVVDVAVSNDSDTDRVLISVSFQIRKENRTAAADFDFSQLSRRFRKSALPLKFEIEFDGAYSFGINDVSDLENNSNVFFVFDHLLAAFTASGDAQNLRLFPAGLTTQAFVLGELELQAEPRSFAFAHRLKLVLSGGDAEGVLSGSDLQNNNFELSALRKTTFEGLFTLSHQDAAGSLELAVRSGNMEDPDATRLRLTGTLAFPRLKLGEQVTLTDAVLTFDESADRATLRAVVRRAQGTVIISGTYDFAESRFHGLADDVPLNINGALIVGR